MVNYWVDCDGIKIRSGPSVNSIAIGMLFHGDVVYGASDPFDNEGKQWVSFEDSNGNLRYLCFHDGSNLLLIPVI
jgi:hypothetical protein